MNWSTEYSDQYSVFFAVQQPPPSPPTPTTQSPQLVDEGVSPIPQEEFSRSIGTQTQQIPASSSTVATKKKVIAISTRPKEDQSNPIPRFVVYGKKSKHVSQLDRIPPEIVYTTTTSKRSSLPLRQQQQQQVPIDKRLQPQSHSSSNIIPLTTSSLVSQTTIPKQQQQTTNQSCRASQTIFVDFRDLLQQREVEAKQRNPRLLHSTPPSFFSSIRPAGISSTLNPEH